MRLLHPDRSHAFALVCFILGYAGLTFGALMFLLAVMGLLGALA